MLQPEEKEKKVPWEGGKNGELDQIITEENLNFRNDWMGLCPMGSERIHFWLWADQRQTCVG